VAASGRVIELVMRGQRRVLAAADRALVHHLETAGCAGPESPLDRAERGQGDNGPRSESPAGQRNR